MFKKLLGIMTGVAVLSLAVAGISSAAPPAFGLQPFVFNPGNACPGMEATWDNSTGNPAPSILLTKPCPTATVAASGVDIVTSLEGQPVSQLTELNFDYKAGEHCGAGAPRFNLELSDGTIVFLGCSGGPQTPAGPGWVHVEYTAAQIQAAVIAAGGAPTDLLNDVYIIFDEGTNTPVGGTIGIAGLVHIDNISVNGESVGSPTSPVNKDDCKKGGWEDLTRADNSTFKNQGDCIQYANTGK